MRRWRGAVRWSVAITASSLLSPGAASGATAKITFLHYLSAETMDLLRPSLEQFQRETGIQVEVISVTSAEVVEKLRVMAAAGLFPDVVRLGSEYINLVATGAFEDLGPWMARDRLATSAYYPVTLSAFQVQGRQLAVPTEISTFALYYNVDRFAEVGLPEPPHDWNASGWRWEDFVQAARRLTVAAAPGVQARYGIQSFGDAAMWPWWWGGDWLDPEARRSLADSPGAQMALQRLADAYRTEAIAGGNFRQGTAASVIDGNWALPGLAKSPPGFRWNVGVLPAGTQRRVILYPNGFFMSNRSAQKEAAWKFIKFFATEVEGAAAWSRAVGRIPSLRRLGPSYVELQRQLLPEVDHAVFLGALNVAQYPTTRRVPEALEVERLINSTWTAVRTGQMPVPAAAADLARQMNALLQGR